MRVCIYQYLVDTDTLKGWTVQLQNQPHGNKQGRSQHTSGMFLSHGTNSTCSIGRGRRRAALIGGRSVDRRRSGARGNSRRRGRRARRGRRRLGRLKFLGGIARTTLVFILALLLSIGIVGVSIYALTKVGLADEVRDGLREGFDIGVGSIVALAGEREVLLFESVNEYVSILLGIQKSECSIPARTSFHRQLHRRSLGTSSARQYTRKLTITNISM